MHSPAHEPLFPDDPRQIGGYRIVARLGAGGMGRVYLGLTQSGRRLAVKVIRPEFADDAEFRRRFGQEVTAAQRVQSLYTAPVIDADPDGPVPWLATAHIPGPSLGTVLLRSGPLPVTTVRTLALGIAEALQAVHKVGIIHRDLKPSNVLLAADGPRVIDFGIARAADATPLTRTGGAVGSPQFMAPEQIRGRAATPALDVFAFGALVHCAATGESPFGQGPGQAVMFRITTEEPRLDGCPPELRPLVERCLAKEPEARPSVAEILAELTDVPDPATAAWLPESVATSLAPYEQIPAPDPVPPPYGGRAQPPGTVPGGPPHPPAPTFGTTPPPFGATPPPAGASLPPGAHAPSFHTPVPAGTGGPFVPGGPPGAAPRRPGRSAGTVLGAAAGALVVLLLVFLAGVLVSRGGDDGTNAGPTGSSGAQGVPEPGSAPAAPEGAAPTPSSTPGGTATPDPGPGSGQKPPGTFLDEYKNIGITEGYGISFTDHPERPREGDDAEEFDLHYNSWISADKFGRLDAAADASYEACHRNTLYEDSLFSWETGERWCVYTAEGLLGIFTIKSSESGHLVIDLKVWQGPADR